MIDAIRATPAETTEDLAYLEEDEAMTRQALDLLGAGKADAYNAAVQHHHRAAGRVLDLSEADLGDESYACPPRRARGRS